MSKCMKTIFALTIALVFSMTAATYAQGGSAVRGALQKPVVISSPDIDSWEAGGTRVFVCSQSVMITHGDVEIMSDECVCWFYEDKGSQSDAATMDVYFNGNVSLLDGKKAERHGQLFLRLETSTGLVFETGEGGVDRFEEEQDQDLYMMAKGLRAQSGGGFSAKDKLPAAGDLSGSSAAHPINIFADEVDSWIEGDTRIITAIGNVKIRRGDVVLDADNVILYTDSKDTDGLALDVNDLNEIYAEGNVTLRHEDDLQMADRLFINYRKNRGILLNGEMRVSIDKKKSLTGTRGRKHERYGSVDLGPDTYPLTAHIKGAEVKLTGDGQYEIKDGEFTSCGLSHPHYKFKSSKIRIVKSDRQTVVSLTGNRAYWRNWSVFYWPYLAFDIRSRPNVLQEWEIANSSRFGSVLSTKWNLFNLGIAENVDKWSDLYLNLDYLQKRGPAAGIDYVYDLPSVSGKLETFYINDTKDEELNGAEVEGKDRWRLSWRHRQYLPHDVRLDVEVNNLSDDGILKEFFERTFKEEKDEEAVLYLRRLRDTEGITALLKKQLNSFDTFVDARKIDKVAERVPEFGYRIIGEPIWKNRFNFTSESHLTYFDRVFNNNADEKEPESSTRFDSNNEVSAPFQVSLVKVKPYIGGRFTGYSDSAEHSNRLRRQRQDDDGSAEGRFIGSIGLDMSTTFWRTYSYYNEFFDINRLRHVFTPEVRYSFNPFVTKEPSDLNQFDSVDRMDDSQWLLLGFRNRLQTKRSLPGRDRERVVDLIYLDVEFNFFLGGAGNNSAFDNHVVFNKRREDFVQFDLKARLNDRVSLVSERNEFSLAGGGFDVFNFGVALDYDPKWRAFLGQRFIEGASSSMLLSANYKFNDKWEAGFLEQFDFRSELSNEDEDPERDLGRNLKSRLVLTRYFHDWVGSFTAEFNPVRDETTTRFDLYPRALKKKERPTRFWF